MTTYSRQDFKPRERRRQRDTAGMYFCAGSAWALFVFWWMIRWAESF